MTSQKLDYLVRRGGQFYFRRWVPKPIIPILNKAEIKLSLQTGDPDEARRRCRIITNAFEKLVSDKGALGEMAELPSNVIDNLIRGYFAQEIESAKELVELGPSYPTPGLEAENEIRLAKQHDQKLKSEIVTTKFTSSTLAAMKEVVGNAGYDLPGRRSEQYDQLCRGIIRAKLERNRIYAAMLAGDYDQIDVKDPLFKIAMDAGQPGSVPTVGQGNSETVQELIDKYIKLKKVNDWTGKTLKDNVRVLNWLSELVGADTKISNVVKGHVDAFRDLVMTVPANFQKKKKFAGMTTLQAAAASEEKDRLSLKTADKYMKTMKSFLNWCAEEEYVTKVPGGKVSVPYKGGSETPREPFSKSQLQSLFSSPLYTGHSTPSRRSTPGDLVIKDAFYWVPLIGLYSGMRLGEILQMHKADVIQEEGIWFFNVVTTTEDNEQILYDDVKSLKTDQSRRRVPVHPKLIELGFLEFLNERKREKSGGLRIFNEEKKGADGYHSHNFSKKFSRYLTAIKIKTKAIVFHSFRHNFKDAMREAEIPDSHQDALMGHIDGKQAKNIYGHGLSLKQLAKNLEKIKYPVDFN